MHIDILYTDTHLQIIIWVNHPNLSRPGPNLKKKDVIFEAGKIVLHQHEVGLKFWRLLHQTVRHRVVVVVNARQPKCADNTGGCPY